MDPETRMLADGSFGGGKGEKGKATNGVKMGKE